MNICKNCEFFKTSGLNGDLTRNTFCSRFPPVAYPVPAQQGIGVINLRPAVDDNDFCGEFKLK